MAISYVVAVEGLSALHSLDDMPADVLTAASRAINDTVRRGRAAGAREIRRQVNFPARYLSGSEGRLKVTKFATPGSLVGVITGRHRPTSLARFSSGGRPTRGGRGGSGVQVEVKPGGARFMRRAFLVQLRSGTERTDTIHNLGLALRVGKGESIRNKKFQVKGGLFGDPNLYLLYGPSVDQVFRSVADDIRPDLDRFLEQTFARLMDLD